MTARPQRPRDAATLILVRRDGGPPRLLMGQRSGGHDFMPGKWVFPGGRICRADYAVPLAAGLPETTLQALAATCRLQRQDGARLARALAAAAVRETFEETGLMLAGSMPRPQRAPAAYAPMAAAGLAPDLSGLTFVARAITPPARHRRFDARFLMADASGLAGLHPADSRELHAVGWFTLDEARGLDLPTVTRAVIDVVAMHLAGRPPEAAPFWRWTRADPRSAL